MTLQTSVHWFLMIFEQPICNIYNKIDFIYNLIIRCLRKKKWNKDTKSLLSGDTLEEYIILVRKPLTLQFHEFFEYFTSEIRGIMYTTILLISEKN